jgi:hypothetical protein
VLDLVQALDEGAADLFQVVAFLFYAGPDASLGEGGLVEVLAAAAGRDECDRGVQQPVGVDAFVVCADPFPYGDAVVVLDDVGAGRTLLTGDAGPALLVPGGQPVGHLAGLGSRQQQRLAAAGCAVPHGQDEVVGQRRPVPGADGQHAVVADVVHFEHVSGGAAGQRFGGDGGPPWG